VKTVEEIKAMIDSNRKDESLERENPTTGKGTRYHEVTLYCIELENKVLQWVLGEKY